MTYDFCELANIPRLCAVDSGYIRHNVGGMREAIVIPEKYILDFPSFNFSFSSASTDQLLGTILLRAGAVGYRFAFTADTGEFTEPMAETDDGVYFDQLFTLSIPKDRPELVWLKYRMRQGRYAIIYRDANGNTKALRNMRVRFDLATGKAGEEYNGQVMYARRAAATPSLHWVLPPTTALDTLFVESEIGLAIHQVTLATGWQAGKQIQLPFAPIDIESILLSYNNALFLLPNEHFTLSGQTITLLGADLALAGSPGELLFYFAANRLNDAIASFAQETFTKTATYTTGETLPLAAAPHDVQHLIIIKDDLLTLRPGIDYSLATNVITLLAGGTPTVGAPEVFHVRYAQLDDAAPLSIQGWKNYRHGMAVAENGTFSLPHTPLANTLFLKLEESFLLREGVHYNLTGNEIEMLIAIDASSELDAWYAY